MKKFMALYMASGPQFEKMMKNSTPEQQKKGMEAWMKWMNANKASIVEGGAPLGKIKRVDSNGASNTKNEVGGYSIVQADRMRRPRSYSAKTILICKCPEHGSKSWRSCRCLRCSDPWRKRRQRLAHRQAGADNSKVWEQSMKIAVLGAGNVGKALGEAFAAGRPKDG